MVFYVNQVKIFFIRIKDLKLGSYKICTHNYLPEFLNKRFGNFDTLVLLETVEM